MRGRVGRSNKKAYCYLLVPLISAMTDDAKKRMSAIEEFSDLGSSIALILFLASSVMAEIDRKSTRLNSSHSQTSYAAFCLQKKRRLRPSRSSGGDPPRTTAPPPSPHASLPSLRRPYAPRRPHRRRPPLLSGTAPR